MYTLHHPPGHVRKGRYSQLRSLRRVYGQSELFQPTHSNESPPAKRFQESLSPTVVPAGVNDNRGIQIQVACRRIRPRNCQHLMVSFLTHFPVHSLFVADDSEMSGLVQ